MWNVKLTKKVVKGIPRLPLEIRAKLLTLVDDLEEFGPIQSSWPNYSKLGKRKYHCHLNYHYAVCWKAEEQTITIEVYYAGSRENAPY